MGNKKIDLTKLERKDLIQYCRDNNIDVRTKDDTKTILKKALKAIESLSDTKVSDTKLKAVVAPKAVSKKEVKKEVSKETKKETKQTSVAKTSSKPTKGQTVIVKKEKVSEETKKNFVPVTFKSIGQNIIVIVDGVQYSKKEPLKSSREEIKKLVEDINKSNTGKDKLLDIFTKKSVETVEKINSFKNLDIDELLNKIIDPKLKEAIYEKLEKKVNKTIKSEPVTSSKPSSRGGEKPYR